MADSYYDRQIEAEQRKINIMSRLVDVAIESLEAKNNRKLNGLNNAWLKVKYAKDAKERSARLNTFLKVLNDEKAFRDRLRSSSEVNKALKDRFRGTNCYVEYEEYSKYAFEISRGARNAVSKYARAYVDAISRIASLERQKAEDAKRTQEKLQQEKADEYRRVREEQTRKEATYSTVYATVPARNERPKVDESAVKAGDKVVYHKYDDFAVREQKALQYLAEKSQMLKDKGYGRFFFTVDEERMLRGVLGDDKYLSVTGLVEEGFALQHVLHRLQKYERESKIPFKKSVNTPKLDDVIDAAVAINRYLPEELMLQTYSLSKEGKYAIKLRNMAQMDHSLEMYEKIYSIYINYFNKLSDEERDRVKYTFNTRGAYEYYKKYFNIKEFEIISPSKLKVFVNSKVKEKILANYTNYMDIDVVHLNTLNRAVTYMEIPDIVSLYHAIKQKYNTYAQVYPGDDEKRQIEAHEECRRNLQRNFVNVILNKMNLGNISLEDKNRKIKEIVENLLHEKLLFEVSVPTAKVSEDVVKEVKEEVAPSRTVKGSDGMYHYQAGGMTERTSNRAMAARYNAQHRFFGMSKLEQTLAKMNGKWAAFQKLWDQAATLDKEEQEEVAQKLDLMFRR